MRINIFQTLIKKYQRWRIFQAYKKRVWNALNTPEAYRQFKMLQRASWEPTLGWKERAAREGFKETNRNKDLPIAPSGEEK